MEVIQIAKQMEDKIKLLEVGRKALGERAKNRAEAIANYEKVLAITIIKLRNGVELELDSNKIKDPPTTIIEKISRGICWKESLEKDKTEAEYRNAIAGMKAIEAELNGFQSINRYLDNTVE